MKCKFCQGEMPDDGVFCPYCGKSNQEESLRQQVEAVEETLQTQGEAVVILEDPAPAQQEPSDVEEAMASPQLRKMKRMAVISGCLAVLAILGTVLFFAVKGGLDLSGMFNWLKPRENTLLGNASYSVSDKKAVSKRSDVIATMAGKELTNGQLQVYYWMQVREEMENNYYQLYMQGFDISKPLDEQQNTEADATWQQYFLKSALETWQSNQVFAILAEENRFQMDEQIQEYLQELPASMEETAKEQGFESADAMLQQQLGAGCTLEDYISYTQVYWTGYLYFNSLYEQIDPKDEEINTFFTENEELLKQYSITKDSGKYYSIRHIQINVTGGTKDEEGKTVYSDAQWKTCQDTAQALLDQWLAGEKTEDSFAELAKANTQDDNTKDYGGSLAGFEKGDLKSTYGEEFDNWCTDAQRKPGDYALLKTEMGYHIVFFAESEDIWYAECRAAVIAQQAQKIVQDAVEKYPAQFDYTKMVLAVVELG